MCFYSLEDFSRAYKDKEYAKCIRCYIDKANQLVANGEKDGFVNRIQMEPYREHGFKALHEYAMETLKMLMLVNGGGAVAVLTLGGRLAKDGTQSFPIFLFWPMIWFITGAFLVMLAGLFAMRSQRHFNEPISTDENKKRIPEIAYSLYRAKRIQFYSMVCAGGSAATFLAGVLFGLNGFK